ncbi:hypothetical protein [Conexibacter sp. SYSU D00693]|uniref:hypothetical protein n=1 Tax=Conexibacter sp. SYSU D00693 TaxID=2812560 RepID=UPI00196AB4BB|nr:hypothetical protein [Conexibacter sp. SYSU D00693]
MLATLIALSATKATVALVAVFFVLFPLLAHGLIGLAVGSALGERAENQEYFERGGARANQRSQG